MIERNAEKTKHQWADYIKRKTDDRRTANTAECIPRELLDLDLQLTIGYTKELTECGLEDGVGARVRQNRNLSQYWMTSSR